MTCDTVSVRSLKDWTLIILTKRCQKSESKKPAICGALKLTKKLRLCRSLQLRRHFVSGRRTVRLVEESDALVSSWFTFQSVESAFLQPAFCGSQGIPFMLE